MPCTANGRARACVYCLDFKILLETARDVTRSENDSCTKKYDAIPRACATHYLGSPTQKTLHITRTKPILAYFPPTRIKGGRRLRHDEHSVPSDALIKLFTRHIYGPTTHCVAISDRTYMECRKQYTLLITSLLYNRQVPDAR